MSYTTALGFTPAFEILKGADPVSAAMRDRVVSIIVQSYEGGGDADRCTIGLDDRGWSIGLPSIGEDSATLTIEMGYAETVMYSMGTFQVDTLGLSYPPKAMTLQGNSVAFTSNLKAPIIAAYDRKTLGDIVGAIAASAGMAPAIDSDLAAVEVPYLNQHASSGHLLAELERRFDALAKFADGKLSFTKRGTGDAASGQSIGSFTLGPEDLAGVDLTLSNRNSYSVVKAAWFDRTAQQLRWISSTVPGSPGSDVPFLLKRPLPSQAEAQAAADAQMSALNRKAKTGTVTLAKGDPSIRGGQGFAIAGTRDGIDGTGYMIRCATHVLTKDGGIASTLDVYDEADADFSGESTDGKLDLSGLPASTIPTTGVGHN